MIQEFGISITAVGGEQYLVRTESVEKGVPHAEERVVWPVTQWLAQTQSLMHDPLLGLLQGQKSRAISNRPVSNTTASARRLSVDSNADSEHADLATLIHLGQTLHRELFKGQLRDSWVTAQGVARNRQDLLRLRLGIRDSRLQQLPWEALHAGPRPLATGTDVIFSRYILNHSQVRSRSQADVEATSQVLRILMVIAAPSDQDRLELKREAHHLQSELHPESVSPDDTLIDVQLKILEQPGRAELTQELERGNYQVLHYAGHSNLGNAGGDLFLVSRQTGLTERLSGEDLAGLLVNNGIKLAVFNSCRGAFSASSDQGWQERNLAQALVNRGMPGVIAMSERIPDHVAISFTQLLYRNLKKGHSIDLSLNRTRQGLISAYGSHQFYWALPTLYLHPTFDGYLVKAPGSLDRDGLENASRLDAANDPFGDMFAEPGLSEVDLPLRLKPDRTKAVSLTGAPTDLSDSRETNKETVFSAVRSTSDDRDAVNDRELAESNDVAATDSVVEDVSLPTPSVDIDGELSVPNNIETPAGFYGEPAKPPAVPSIGHSSKSDFSAQEVPSGRRGTARQSDESQQDRRIQDERKRPDTSVDTSQEGAPELIGERLTRSHTLHTKLLTGQTLAFLVLVALLAVATVGWLRREPAAPNSQANSQDTISSVENLTLPAAIEVALNQGDLDAAATAAKTLINQGEFEPVLSALQTADREQMEDVAISFLRGRAQWGLVKQGDPDFAPADAMLSWSTAIASEPDWLEIKMALGFAQYAAGEEQAALENWEEVVAQAARAPEAKGTYFSEQPYGEYALNAQAGIAMAALSLSKIEADPAERNRLFNQAAEAYQQVMREDSAAFRSSALGSNWLWLGSAIADWSDAKEELSQTLSTE